MHSNSYGIAKWNCAELQGENDKVLICTHIGHVYVFLGQWFSVGFAS